MALQSARFRGNPRFDQIHAGDTTAYLRVNDNNDEVREIQYALIDLGYSIPSGATGLFGPQTSAAVVAFKTDEALVPNDAVVGQKTVTTLDAYFALPFADREEWLSWTQRRLPTFNFTRLDELNRLNAGQTYTWSASSAWMPQRFKDALASGISQILDPFGSPVARYSPSGTWGVSPLDLYHCHLVIDGIPDPGPTPPGWFECEELGKKIAARRKKCSDQASAVAGSPDTPAWMAQYRSRLLAPAPPGQRSYLDMGTDLLNLIAATSVAPATARPVYMLWHSFEERLWRPTGMTKSDPRRYWCCEVTPNLTTVTSAPIDISPGAGYRLLFENICFVMDKAGVITAVPGALMEEIGCVTNLDVQDFVAAAAGLPYP